MSDDEKRTGYLWNTLYGWVDTGSGGLMPSSVAHGLQPISHHVAHPDTKRRLHELVMSSRLIDHLVQIDAVPATRADVARVHDTAYIDRIDAEGALPKGGDAGDGVSPFGQGGEQLAYLAAGGAIEATKAVLDGTVDRAYALINPPGHHAERAVGRGFCIFNNTAVAAAYALDVAGLDRVAIVDWDVHHGNGAQDIFAESSQVLNISLHQNRCFPADSGFIEENGFGEGAGHSLNIPLPPGGGNAVYEYALESVVIPALEVFRPQLILVPCGFDAGIMDPLSRMMVRADGFRRMTRLIVDAAERICGGKVVFLQEGGYSPYYVPFCGLATIEELAGVSSGLSDAYSPIVGAMGGDELLDHEREAVDAAKVLVRRVSSPATN
ncbi:class II histone deacetylase [Salinibacterium sp. PAMC 21357]|uniref:class II histone deacetylase n=1 Tax=Salinibacterium sp. PAMC 21357 TaxID=1112215 RepID=UPI000288494E|nr:class II histone deacetylase [Salinibacterium sp. PAMC 21357]